MKIQILRTLALAAASVALTASLPAAEPAAKAPFTVTRYQSSIDEFLAADKANPPTKDGILFIGSSIFRQWTDLKRQMAPLPVFNRAFGGSRTVEVLHYADKVVIPYAPKVVVYYCGSNDINADEKPAAIAGHFREFVERVHQKLPKTKVIYASILRAPQKEKLWNVVNETNKLVSDYCKTDARLTYVDINGAVFEANGKPRDDLYLDDKLHYKPVTYFGFTSILRPVLFQVWESVK